MSFASPRNARRKTPFKPLQSPCLTPLPPAPRARYSLIKRPKHGSPTEIPNPRNSRWLLGQFAYSLLPVLRHLPINCIKVSLAMSYNSPFLLRPTPFDCVYCNEYHIKKWSFYNNQFPVELARFHVGIGASLEKRCFLRVTPPLCCFSPEALVLS